MNPHSTVLFLLVTFLLGISFWIGKQQYRTATERDSGFILLLLLPALVTFLILIGFKIAGVIFDIHSWIRFQKSAALAFGFPIYFGQQDGPALATIYGPVSAWFYAPAAWTREPFSALRIACTLAAASFFLPAWWLHRLTASRNRRAFAFLAFCCFGLLAILLTSLRLAAFTVHTDAPAIGLAALSAGLLWLAPEKNRIPFYAASALFAALSVWTKQVVVPIAVLFPLYAGFTRGRRDFFIYSGLFAVIGITVSALMLLLFDPAALFFQMFTVPSHHPFKDGANLGAILKASSRVFREWAVAALVGFVPLQALFRSCTAEFSWRRSLSFLCLLIGLAMAPLAILSNIKVGGSNNTLSYATYFVLAAATLLWVEWYEKRDGQAIPSKIRPQQGIAILAGILLVISIPVAYARAIDWTNRTDFAGHAWQFIKNNPEETYFPRLNALHLFAEQKQYHTIDGLMDRHWAGMPVSESHLRRYIPEKARFIAMYEENHEWLLPLEEFQVGYQDGMKELPGFLVFPRNNQKELLTNR